MGSITDMQVLSREQYMFYDETSDFFTVFTSKEELETFDGNYIGYFRPVTVAYDEGMEWFQYHKDEVLDTHRVFAVVFESDTLKLAGFSTPTVSNNPAGWNQKIDDDFDEMRINHPVWLSPCSYFPLWEELRASGD